LLEFDDRLARHFVGGCTECPCYSPERSAMYTLRVSPTKPLNTT
jgi:hypothetical protein